MASVALMSLNIEAAIATSVAECSSALVMINSASSADMWPVAWSIVSPPEVAGTNEMPTSRSN